MNDIQDYTLMHKSKKVADIVIDSATAAIIAIGDVYDIEHIPVGISVSYGEVNRGELNKWWLGRAIPASRMGLKDVLEVLGLGDSAELLTKAFGLSLSDQYWISPKQESLIWRDVNFFENDFSDDIGNVLFGERCDSEAISFLSPDNTSDGWLKKKWKIIDGKRCLLKGGSYPFQQETYNEVVASLICGCLNIFHIPYYLMEQNEYPVSVCENFVTSETELISAWSIYQTAKKPNHLSVYQHYLSRVSALNIPNVVESVNQMMVLDYLIGNEDRHLNNFGVLRNAETLEYLGPAPIFDSGSSLGFRFITSRMKSDAAIPCKPFKTSHEEQIKLVTDFSFVDFEKLRNLKEPFMKIFQDSEFVEPSRAEAIYNIYLQRVDMLERHMEQHGKARATMIHNLAFDVEMNEAYSGEELE